MVAFWIRLNGVDDEGSSVYGSERYRKVEGVSVPRKGDAVEVYAEDERRTVDLFVQGVYHYFTPPHIILDVDLPNDVLMRREQQGTLMACGYMTEREFEVLKERSEV